MRTSVVIFILFLLSGAASLVYEVVWMRELTLVFGATTYAIATILSTFMGGLAIGSLLFGRYVDRIERPLFVYALLEVGIGIFALIVPWLFDISRAIYVELYGTGMSRGALIAARAVLSMLVLLPPTVLMGGTLPVLAAFLIRRRGDVGHQTGLLYFVNTAGAVAGTMLAGFWLIENLGLAGTARVGALANFGLAVLAILAQRIPEVGTRKERVEEPSESGTMLSPGTVKLVLFCICLSGFTSLAYEVLWSRALLRYLYNSTYAFTTMLSVFLSGLAVGSILFVVLPWRRRRPLRLFAVLEIGVGAGFLVSALLFEDLRGNAAAVMGEEVKVLTTFTESLVAIGMRAFLVLFLPAVFLGATVPLATDLCARRLATIGQTVGRVYSVNTLGAILGSLVATFVLIPVLGMFGTLALLVGLNLAIALALIAADVPSPAGRIATSGILAAAFAGTLYVVPSDLFKKTFTIPGWELVFYQEGATDTVGVIEKKGQRIIVYDDLRGTASTTTYPMNFVFGHLPALLFPGEPKTALHICFGVGNSLSALALHESLTEVDSVELSPNALDAAKYFWTNNNVRENPKINTIIDDGRNYVMASRKTYDLIELEPPETFTAGVIHLYTREFYEHAAQRMTDDGVLVQWVPVGEATLEDEKMLFRAFWEVFPHGTAWQELYVDGPILLVGTKKPLEIDYQLLKDKMNRPGVKRDMELSHVADVDMLLSMFIFDAKAMAEFVDGVEPTVDDRTVLDFSMPRYIGSGFGLGTFSIEARSQGQTAYQLSLVRGRYYLDNRVSVAPYLTNIGGESREAVEERILSIERPVTNYLNLNYAIPRSQWNRSGP